MNQCKIIGLTGGIGAGKSVVSRLLRGFGFKVYDCDLEARRIMDNSAELKKEISNRLGEECVLRDGSLHRQKIAEVVFTDENHRLWLNNRVHSLVRNDIKSQVAISGQKVIIVESAILKTGGISEMCDEIWIVTAPEDIRIERACDRDKVSPAKIEARMKAQKSEYEDFSDISTKFIDNSGTRALMPQVLQLLKSI